MVDFNELKKAVKSVNAGQEIYVAQNAKTTEDAIKLILEIREEERNYKRIENEYDEYKLKNGIRSKIDYTVVEQIRDFY